MVPDVLEVSMDGLMVLEWFACFRYIDIGQILFIWQVSHVRSNEVI